MQTLNSEDTYLVIQFIYSALHPSNYSLVIQFCTFSGFDIKSIDPERISKLKTKYGVSMTSSEDDLYEDNCVTGTYNMYSAEKIDRMWEKNNERIEKYKKYALFVLRYIT